jgi:hypothetical protein
MTLINAHVSTKSPSRSTISAWSLISEIFEVFLTSPRVMGRYALLPFAAFLLILILPWLIIEPTQAGISSWSALSRLIGFMFEIHFFATWIPFVVNRNIDSLRTPIFSIGAPERNFLVCLLLISLLAVIASLVVTGIPLISFELLGVPLESLGTFWTSAFIAVGFFAGCYSMVRLSPLYAIAIFENRIDLRAAMNQSACYGARLVAILMCTAIPIGVFVGFTVTSIGLLLRSLSIQPDLNEFSVTASLWQEAAKFIRDFIMILTLVTLGTLIYRRSGPTITSQEHSS